MTDRKRKPTHHGEQEESDERSSECSRELQTMMRFMVEENERAESRRENEAKKAEARQVAAEERAEARRREDKFAEEGRIEARRIAAEERAEARRMAEARELRQFEAAREEAARLASEKLVEQQEAAARRAYEQQVELMKIQAELGEKAVKVHREEQVAERRRDKAIASIPTFREGEDIEEYLLTVEKRIKEEDWVAIVAFKLSGRLGSVWQDVSATVDEYKEVKDRVFRVCGHTPKLAAEIFFNFKSEQSRGLTADQLYYRGKQLFRRMVAPHRIEEEAEFTILRGWMSAVVPRGARVALDAWTVTNSGELVDIIQDYLMMEGGRTEGQAAVFKKSQENEGSREKMVTCFKCGKQGHKAFECGVEETSFGSQAAGFSSNPKITFFSCGVDGHKSTQCPNKNENGKAEPPLLKNIKAEPKGVPARPVRRIRSHPNRDTVLEMTVNSQAASVLLDSGSSITVVPETMVAQAQTTGETVEIRGFGAKESLVLPLAEVPFEVDTLSWTETVALAPAEAGEKEVVYGLDLVSTRGMKLVYLANVLKSREVSTGDGMPAADRPAGGPEPAVNVGEQEELEEVEEVEELEEQKSDVGFLVEEEEEYAEEKMYRMRRLVIVDNSLDFSTTDPGVVGGD